MSLLSINGLTEMGAFTGAPVEKEITWEQSGEEVSATVFVRRLSYHTAVSDIKSTKEKMDAVAGRIAACICDAEGKPIFTAGDITGEANPERGPLNENLTIALLAAIAQVSGLGKPTPKS